MSSPISATQEITSSSPDDDNKVEAVSDASEDDEDDDSTSGYSTDDDDDEEDDEEEEGYSSSSEASLGALIEEMGGESALAALEPRMISRNRAVKRSTSVPRLTMQLEADVAASSIEDDQQRQSLLNFMERMQNASDSYFQAPAADSNTNNQQREDRRRVNSTGALEDIRKNTLHTDNPANFFLEMIEKELPEKGDLFSDSYWEAYFLPITPQRRQAYLPNVVSAIRNQDMDTLKTILTKEGDASMEACNAQGETLLHLACRRRNIDLVKFLLITAHVSCKVRDDFGKTPLHEICWYTEPRNPSQFDAVEFLMVCGPEMFFAKDKRGYTPLQYAPKNTWPDWCRFISRNRDSIRAQVRTMKFS